MSSPAQNARPEPVMTTTRTSSSIWICVSTSVRSRFIACVEPLSRSGWLSVIVATPLADVATSKPRKRPSVISAEGCQAASAQAGRQAPGP